MVLQFAMVFTIESITVTPNCFSIPCYKKLHMWFRKVAWEHTQFALFCCCNESHDHNRYNYKKGYSENMDTKEEKDTSETAILKNFGKMENKFRL